MKHLQGKEVQFSASTSHHLFPLGQKYPMSTTHQALSEFCPVKTGIRGRFLRPQWHLGLDLKILWWLGVVGFHSPLGSLSHVSLKSIFGNNSNCSCHRIHGDSSPFICWSCLPSPMMTKKMLPTIHNSATCIRFVGCFLAIQWEVPIILSTLIISYGYAR